jgi:hypothetical protein
MHKTMVAAAISIVAVAASAAAQTVTGLGTPGAVAMFTETSTLGSSVIS